MLEDLLRGLAKTSSGATDQWLRALRCLLRLPLQDHATGRKRKRRPVDGAPTNPRATRKVGPLPNLALLAVLASRFARSSFALAFALRLSLAALHLRLVGKQKNASPAPEASRSNR